MKNNLLISFLIINKILSAQAFPTYKGVLDQKNKASLSESIGPISALTTAGSALLLRTKIHPLDESVIRDFEVQEAAEAAQAQTLSLGLNASNLALLSSSLGIIFVFSPLAIKLLGEFSDSNSEDKKNFSLNYKYSIKNNRGENICRGTKHLFFGEKNRLSARISNEDLNANCRVKLREGENYFIRLDNKLGKPIINWKRMIYHRN